MTHALTMPARIDKTAVIEGPADCYRYYLTRTWDIHRPVLCWIMLNPSTADALKDDNTITKCIRFAHQWDFGGISVVNLFAYRTPSPLVLRSTHDKDVIGPDNMMWVVQACAGARKIICAWGAHGDYMGRSALVTNRLLEISFTLYKLGTCANGQPQHPLRLPYSRKLEVYREAS